MIRSFHSSAAIRKSDSIMNNQGKRHLCRVITLGNIRLNCNLLIVKLCLQHCPQFPNYLMLILVPMTQSFLVLTVKSTSACCDLRGRDNIVKTCVCPHVKTHLNVLKQPHCKVSPRRVKVNDLF